MAMAIAAAPAELDPHTESIGSEKGQILAAVHAVGDYQPETASFEAALYWAKLSRQREDAAVTGRLENSTEKAPTVVFSPKHQSRIDFQRSLRVSTALRIFLLIITDTLGPGNAPWAFSQLGYGGGTILFLVFGGVAAFGGALLWTMYLRLDSDEYPVRSYGQLSGLLWGKTAETILNFMVSLQLLVVVAITVLGNGQGLSQSVNGRLCFTVCLLVWSLFGMITTQVQSLHHVATAASLAVVLNFTVIFMTMGGAAAYPPNYATALISNGVSEGPVVIKAFISTGFANNVNGALQATYGFTGSMLFLEFISEMRRPWNFWKSLIASQAVIILAYITYSLVIYCLQGQFTINPGYQGVGNYALLTAGNSINFVSAMVTGTVLANCGAKYLYAIFVQDVFKGPLMHTTKGRIIWGLLVVTYWALAYVIASAVPQFAYLSGIVSALGAIQFTYTLPFGFYLTFMLCRDAMEGEPEWHPGCQPGSTRIDTWRQSSRWMRAVKKQWALKLCLLLLMLACLSAAGLGSYSSIEGIIYSFSIPYAATSFSCAAPV